MSNKWYQRWIDMAELVSTWSKDPSTKVGAVIVYSNVLLSTGFNGMPRGIDETLPERWYRPEKYLWVEHAERNAIYNAASSGTSIKGSCLYLNYSPTICCDCARAIIQAGIWRVIGPANKPFPGRGAGVHYHDGRAMLKEAGVVVDEV